MNNNETRRRYQARRAYEAAEAIEVPEDMTPSQVQSLRSIRRSAEEKILNPEKGTVLTWDVKPLTPESGIWIVYAKVRTSAPGTVGDFFPYRGHFLIGKRGGIKICGLEESREFKGKVTRARKHPLIYGWVS